MVEEIKLKKSVDSFFFFKELGVDIDDISRQKFDTKLPYL